ncbi:PepSY domain-containing protein [Frigidibacter albus]|uniref:PepSY domain-containing protein n=1 Tax=Frigidibacter albus TaxID=1465486 RepID=A0A6L8VHZ8_9RHOB|nr:PepSY domain-containing protein [Frigidibacter albus]MZQ88830.1 PepSY domain-containing protein [Frigidibacter albus]NBE30361.1 PepSY domain-containing protein [Frigidibacter albus]GGH50741.1 hypothetical protein GCM10011341_13940 [Frigidibacter albus]
MKHLLAAAALVLLAAPAFAEATPEQIAAIDAKLAEMQCEVDPDNIEMEDGGFELDDAICIDGQYDIVMDADLNVTEQRKE